MERDALNKTESSITINDRKSIIVTGVKKIDSFSSQEFLMETTLGNLSIKGVELEIVKLDTYQGNVAIKGVINSVIYKEDNHKKEESIFTKLFK